MPINAGYEFFDAEKKYLEAESTDDKIFYLEQMLKLSPKHKSSEKFNAELKTRLKKLREKSEKASKKAGGKKGIRKEGFQFLLIGFTNSGKSFLLTKLTNAKPRTSEHQFTTTFPEIGTFYHRGIKAQIIDQPSLGSDNFDVGIANNADCLIYVITNFEEIEMIRNKIPRARGEVIVVFNKSDLLDETQKRKVQATIRSKRLNGVLISTITEESIEDLKSKLFQETGLIRVYMKEPGKERSSIPMVLSPNSTVKDVAEKILKGFSHRVKQTRITGPSSKFPNQKVGLTHKVKDKDVIEFHSR
ncbi:MAG: GTPase [archaeon]